MLGIDQSCSIGGKGFTGGEAEAALTYVCFRKTLPYVGWKRTFAD